MRRNAHPLMAAAAALLGLLGHGHGFAHAAPVPCDRDKRPLADVFPTLGRASQLPIAGRVRCVPLERNAAQVKAGSEVTQEEIPGAELELVLLGVVPSSENPADSPAGAPKLGVGTVRCDEEGYFNSALDLAARGVPPGNHRIAVLLRGSPVGLIRARVLPEQDPPLVVRSDVDMTYLSTDFHGAAAMAKLLDQGGRDKVALPATELVYRALRRGATGREDRPLSFLSGSPAFFKVVLESKMALDGVLLDTLTLKPMKDMAARLAALGRLHELKATLSEQIGYKLEALLRLALHVPPGTSELLMGDDTEADAAAYAIYHRFRAGELEGEALDALLAKVGVSPDARAAVRALSPQVRALHGRASPVRAIYINETPHPNPAQPVASWTLPGLTRYHRGAWPLILDLYQEGLVGTADVDAVRARLETLGVDQRARDEAAAMALARGFLSAQTLAEH